MQKVILKYLPLFTLIIITIGACSGEKKKAGLEVAPQFSLMDLDSVTHTLPEFEGEIIMVHFWADWCAHCRQEFTELQAAYDSLKGKGFNLVAINSGQEWAIAEGIKREYKLSFPMLLDPDTKVSERYGVKGLPTSFFIDRNGRVLDRYIGWVKRENVYDIFFKVRAGAI